MKQPKNSLLIPILIFLGLLLAFSPVFLSSNYIRQDDLMWEIWEGMKISDFGWLYKNTVFQLVRPICMISFYLTDLISINITDAVYVRFMAVIILGFLGILLYRWQLLFNSNRALAASFAAASFTLPAYQVFAATGNYSLILTALLMTFGAAFCWHHAYQTDQPKQKSRYYRLGCFLFFASLLDYPLSSMYIWVLLTISYLNGREYLQRKFIAHASWVSIKIMVYYYIFCRLVHLVFHVKTNNGRAAVIDLSQIGEKIKHFYDTTGWHSSLWFWKSTGPLHQTPFILIVVVFCLALIKTGKLNGETCLRNNLKHASLALLITFIFYSLSYSPIFASPELLVTFRYTITTMPIFLYLIFWSVNVLIGTLFLNRPLLNKIINTCNSIVFVCVAFFGLTYANIMLADGIVGPHTQDFDNIQKQLNEKVLPLLKQNKQIVIHAIACDNGDEATRFAPNIPSQFEYGMRICQYQQQVLGAIVHSLKKMGYASNFNRKNKLVHKENEIIVNDIPWGTLVVTSAINRNVDLREYTENNRPVITIDTLAMPIYQRFDFYHQLIAQFKGAG